MAACAVAAVVGALLVAPFGAGPTAAEAITAASALFDVTESGRILETDAVTRQGRTETSQSVIEWSGDRLRIASTATGTIWAPDEEFFTPAAFEAINIGNESWVSLDGASFVPAEFEETAPTDDDPIGTIAQTAASFDSCETPSGDPTLTSWCTTTASSTVMGAIMDWPSELVSTVDPVVIRVDLHADTGMVAAVRLEATNVTFQTPEAMQGASIDQWTVDTMVNERVYEALGESVEISRPTE